MFFSSSMFFRWISVISLNFFSHYFNYLYILKAILKSPHRHISISTLASLCLKNENVIANIKLVLIYLATASFCYNYLFLYDLFLNHQKASISVLEKMLFGFLEHVPISISKNIVVVKTLRSFAVKNQFWSS